MKYERIVMGRFIDRPNRFIAHVDIDGITTKVHVKNTGRCRELLQPGATVYLEKAKEKTRSTEYDLVCVHKLGTGLVNMDSQAPNKIIKEWLSEGNLYPDMTYLKPEYTLGNSRYDFYLETPDKKVLVEVKGVTLERNGVASFPDAPSERALKHIEGLIEHRKEGYETVIIFCVQMENMSVVLPNEETQPEFALALQRAKEAGVKVVAVGCEVTLKEGKNEFLTIAVNPKGQIQVMYSLLEWMQFPLLSWYKKVGRTLPWRENPTPYHVWVSEIMLQQTRVEAVKGYYHRFMEELPDIYELSVASEERLLKLWEGLGYYSRVRNLQKAAKVVMEDYAGEMPEDYEELLKLPGIGSYTAGAISSIAYQKKHPAVDGNVLRVASRLLAEEKELTDPVFKKSVEERLLQLMSTEEPGNLNQALMDLGATVCIPNGMPHCDDCPLKEQCIAHRLHEELNFPKAKEKKERTKEYKTVLIIRDREKVAIVKRPSKGLLAGMYEFPSVSGQLKEKEVLSYVKGKGLSVLTIKSLPASKHIFTHKEWHMVGYRLQVDELTPFSVEEQDLIFTDAKELTEKYPIPTAYKTYQSAFLEEVCYNAFVYK